MMGSDGWGMGWGMGGFGPLLLILIVGGAIYYFARMRPSDCRATIMMAGHRQLNWPIWPTSSSKNMDTGVVVVWQYVIAATITLIAAYQETRQSGAALDRRRLASRDYFITDG
jgi:hypothetical protein